MGQGWEVLVSSEEQKAVETAEVLGASLALSLTTDPALGENDRSATGFLPPEEFERTADEFFAQPDDSIRGWETASAAQRRITRAVRRISSTAPGRRIVFVGHGAVGALLLSDLTGRPITRELDQPRQGCWFAFDPTSWSADIGWRALPDG